MKNIGTDPDAFEAFYRAHLDLVHRFVARRVADPELAADLTADVFVAAIEHAHRYRPDRGSPTGWLYGIARNVVAGHHRSTARELRAVSRIQGRRLLDADSLERARERIDAERDVRELYTRIASLPDGEQAVLELVAVDGLSLTEAAAALDIRPGTARVRLHRARRALATQPTPVKDRT